MSTAFPVLVSVDDEQLNLDLVRRVMSASYSVHTFVDPRVALTSIPALRPNVLLIDFKMPIMSGLELLHELRVGGVEAPALLVTAFADAGEVRAAERDKLILRTLAKPWRVPELQGEVALAVSIGRMDRARRALHVATISPPLAE